MSARPAARGPTSAASHDICFVGGELSQGGEQICAFLAAQWRQAGDDQLHMQLGILFCQGRYPRVGGILAGLDRGDQPVRLKRLNGQRGQQVFKSGKRAGRREHQGDARGWPVGWKSQL
jgi:hypothetical protein